MTHTTRSICAGISGLFFLGIVLYFGTCGFGAFWFAIVCSLVLLAIQLGTWALAREKNFIVYALSFIPSCVLVPAFLTGQILFSPWFWACLATFVAVQILSALRWTIARQSTLYWLGTPCYLVIFLALAGYLYSL